jgi:flagellar biosynthesis/type III secretory pathway chaperone
MPDVTIEGIDELLEDERRALLSGDLMALSSIADRKEALAQQLSGTKPAGPELVALRRKAERNAELLEAATKGLRSVTRRLAEIQRANGPLETYGQDGTRHTLGAGRGSLEKKA